MADLETPLDFSQLMLFSKDEEGVRKATQSLYDWGVCPRCVFRFLGEERPAFYKKDVQTLYEWIKSCYPEDQVPPLITDEQSVCVLCLGILQDYYCSKEFLLQVKKKVVSEAFEHEAFVCHLSIPVTHILREHSVWTLLRESHSQVYYGRNPEEVVSLKDVWRWVTAHMLGELLEVPMDIKSPFEICLNFDHPDTTREPSFLLDVFPDTFRQRKNTSKQTVFNRTNVMNALKNMSEGKFRRCYKSPPKKLKSIIVCDPISCQHDALFLGGRYVKYSRELPQTPWLVGGERRNLSSIQELICDSIASHIKPSEFRFSASGREDVDVKCLGNGRPFVIELLNPRKVTFDAETLLSMTKEVNDKTEKILIRDLQVISREDTLILREGETEKTKCYSALCYSEDEVSQKDLDSLKDLTDLKLQQKTPIRVLHRRPLAARERIIHSISGSCVDKHHFRIQLKTQAGTYIKEFVHGDFGRTIPNLSTLLKHDCDILELDVEAVELEWPPKAKIEDQG